jgi:hypothetical protein
MGVRILHDEANAMAAFFCSTSDFAFGPVFCNKEGRPASERAEAFNRWLLHRSNWPNKVAGIFGRFDLRVLNDSQMEQAYGEWLVQEAGQYEAEGLEARAELEAERAELDAEERRDRALETEARLHPERFA